MAETDGRPVAGGDDVRPEDDLDIEIVDDPPEGDDGAQDAEPEPPQDGKDEPAAGDGDGGDGEDRAPDDDLRRERARRRKAERERDAYARRIAEIDERQQRIESVVNQQQLGQLEARLAATDQEIRDAKAARRQALADGDHEAEEAATERWIRRQADRDRLAAYVEQVKRGGATPPRDAQQPQTRRGEGEGSAGPSPQARDWMRRNSWFDPEFGDEESRVAASLSQTLLDNGLAADDPRHFRELDKRLSRLYPHLYRNPAASRPSAAAGGSRSGAAERGNGRQPVKVPKALVEHFRQAGMDVNDPKVKRQMIQSYQETQQRLTGRAGR